MASTPVAPSSLNLKGQMAAHENSILRGAAPDSFRGVEDYRVDFGHFGLDILSCIAGKIVGDLGSGYGGFAKTLALTQSVNALVHPINPHLRNPRYKACEEREGRIALKRTFPQATDEDLDRAQRLHDQHLSFDFAHKLRSFQNGTFHILLDILAADTYTPPSYEALYRKMTQERLRVLRRGGMLLITDYGRHAIGYRDGSGIVPMKERVLQELGVSYTPSYTNGNKCDPNGALIIKR